MFSLVEVCDEPVLSVVECFGDVFTCAGDVGERLGTRIFDLLYALLQSGIDRLVETAVLQIFCELID
jgi:hypothetical protein